MNEIIVRINREKYLVDTISKFNDVQDDSSQLQFNFDYSSIYELPIQQECISVYKKPDGTFYTKTTKIRPINKYDTTQRINVGYKNSFGHTLVDVYQQYKFDI